MTKDVLGVLIEISLHNTKGNLSCINEVYARRLKIKLSNPAINTEPLFDDGILNFDSGACWGLIYL